MTEYTVSLRGPVTAQKDTRSTIQLIQYVTADAMAPLTAYLDHSCGWLQSATGIASVNAGTTDSARGEASFGVPVVTGDQTRYRALMQNAPIKDNEDNGGFVLGLVRPTSSVAHKYAKGTSPIPRPAQIFLGCFHVKKAVDKTDPKKVLEGAEFTCNWCNGGCCDGNLIKRGTFL